MAAACFRATYTLDGHKKLAKNRRWLDGFVSQQGQEGRLYDESGALVATARLAAAVLEEGAEIDRGLFGQNIIVTVDVPCSPEEVRGGGAGGQARAAPAAGLPAAPARAAPTLAESAVSSKTAAPSGRATAAGGRRTTFKAPRLMPAGPASVASEPRSMPPAPAATPRGFVPPTAAAVPQPSGFKAQPAQLLWQHPGSMQPGAAPTCVRSDDDILRLLMGQATRPPAAPAAAEEPPVAKRARLQAPAASSMQPEHPEKPAPAFPAAGVPAPAPAAAALPQPRPVTRAKWSSFLAEEDELQLEEEEASPPLAGSRRRGGRGAAPGAAAPPAAAQRWQQPQPQQGQQQERQGIPPGAWQPSLSTALAASAPGHVEASRLGDTSPGGSAGPPSGFRPIVRPLQAGGRGAMQPAPLPDHMKQQIQQQQSQQRQAAWPAQQRPPLQPNRQQPAQQAAGRPAAAGGGANAGAWKAPAQLRPAAGGGFGAGRPAGAAPATSGPPPAAPVGGWNRLLDGAVQLGWPTAEEAARPARRVAVPDAFASSQQYVQVWTNALLEELNLRIVQVAQPFHNALDRASQQQPPAGPGVRQPGGRHDGGRGGRRGGGQGGGSGGAGLEACLRQARVPYYGHCELFSWKNNFKSGGGAKGKRGRRSQCEDSDDGEGEAATKPESVYLVLKSGRQKSAEYRKDDLWVLSSTPDFRSGFAPGQPGDRSRAPWLAVARSLWHGPNQDGKFEIEFLSARPPGLGRSQAVYAIKGPDASSELGMIELLRSGAPAAMPLLTHLLRAKVGAGGAQLQQGSAGGAGQQQEGQPAQPDSPCYSCSEDDGDVGGPAPSGSSAEGLTESPLLQAERICRRFGLNQEQGEVLQYVASWCQPGGGTGSAGTRACGRAAAGVPPPICLVHGPFGSGKSTLLVALLHFLLQQRGQQGSPLAGARVLVSAHTNVAVDRVLLGLLESGCTDFLRVGPLRRVSRRLLGQSLHASESRATATAAAELREMLKEASSPAEKAVIQAELAAAERGADRQRRRLLKTVPVVGVTCCSSLLSALDGQHFDVVVLDECSQMVEPLSAVPLLRARAKYLVAAGDPLQLPPVVAAPSQVSAPAENKARQQQQPHGAQLHGLLRPLFVRLAALGLPPFLLRRQYRCHPDIAAVPNSHFYGGRLLDGCTPQQRASLLPGLPSLAFLDVRGQEQYGAGRSASNPAEAEAVVSAVEQLAAAGVALGRVGVICFFRAQVALVRSLLERCLPQLQREEQRRGQAAGPAGPCEPQPEAAAGDQGVVNLLVGSSRLGRRGAAGRASVGSGDGEAGEVAEAQAPQGIQVATVDSFQGAECDVIILTTAVTRPGAFASDACRLNVALTRAKHNLLIVGCAPALQQSAPAFAALLARCRSTPGSYFQGRLPPPAAFAAQAARAQAPALLPAQPAQAAEPGQQAQQQQAQAQQQQQTQPLLQPELQAAVAAATQQATNQAAKQATAESLEDSWSWSDGGAESDAEDLPLSKRQQQLQQQQGTGNPSTAAEEVLGPAGEAGPAVLTGRQAAALAVASEEQPGSAPASDML